MKNILYYMLETPKALSTHLIFNNYKNRIVKILKIIQWTISRKPKKLQIKTKTKQKTKQKQKKQN